MPRYFFHIRHGESRPDHEGVVLADEEQAWEQAMRTCGEMMRDLDGEFKKGTEWRMDITDERARPLFVIRFSAEWPDR